MLKLAAATLAMLLVTSPVDAQARNQVVGTWKIISAKADPKGANRDLYGPDPSGQLIFTPDLHFAVIINKPDVPAFAADDRAKGTEAENRAAMAGALGLYGAYTVDAEGRFAGEHVVGSTFPNWNGLDRATSSLTETPDAHGDTMIEHLQDHGKPLIEIVWRRVR